MLKSLTLFVATVLPLTSLAAGVEGVWKTEANEEGGYLEVTVGSCAGDAGLTCGLITRAVRADGPNPGYENLGKLMIKDMQQDGASKYSGGTIWDPEADKVYKSKMQLNEGQLEVEGCIAFLCDGQTWTRVE